MIDFLKIIINRTHTNKIKKFQFYQNKKKNFLNKENINFELIINNQFIRVVDFKF